MPPAPTERVQVLDRGNLRLGKPTRGDDQARGREVAPRRADEPARLVLVPLRLRNRAVQPQVTVESFVPDARAQVGVDLTSFGEDAGPFGVRPEGERVQVRGDVAGHTGIAVVPPRPANVVGLLDDDERVPATPLELDTHADPGKAGANDEDVHRCAAAGVIHRLEPRRTWWCAA